MNQMKSIFTKVKPTFWDWGRGPMKPLQTPPAESLLLQIHITQSKDDM